MTDVIATRYNNYDSNRPPVELGARYDTMSSSPALTRLGEAVSLTVNTGVTPHDSDFDAYMPWSGMKRCVLNSVGGDLVAYQGDLDDTGAISLFSCTSSKVMVEIPKFWYKFEVTDSTNYDYWISPYPIKGYRLHPAFVRGGIPVDNVYVGAFEAYTSSSYCYSKANVTPTVSASRATFRTAAELWNTSTVAGYGWTLLGYNVYNALQLLYLIEYASFASQAQIGTGLEHIAAVQKTGWTTSEALGGPAGATDLGSESGQVAVAGADYAMSYRGIENLWGNTWTLLDGMHIAATTRKPLINYGYVVNSTAGTGYLSSWCTLPAAAGSNWIKTPYFTTSMREGAQFLPYTYGAPADATHHMCDYYTGPADWNSARIARVGGAFDTDATLANSGGLFSLDVTFAAATSAANTSSRVQYVPYDYMNWTRY